MAQLSLGPPSGINSKNLSGEIDDFFRRADALAGLTCPALVRQGFMTCRHPHDRAA